MFNFLREQQKKGGHVIHNDFYNSKGPNNWLIISANGIFYFIVRNFIHILSTELSSLDCLPNLIFWYLFFSIKKKLDINQSLLIICKTKINFKNHFELPPLGMKSFMPEKIIASEIQCHSTTYNLNPCKILKLVDIFLHWFPKVWTCSRFGFKCLVVLKRWNPQKRNMCHQNMRLGKSILGT